MRFSLIFIYLFCLFSFSQAKNEKETRIAPKDFPAKALALLKTLPAQKRIKYFKETDNSKISYEAKLKLNHKRYSIEFDQNGVLEDIEITIKKSNVPHAVILNITSYLETHYRKYYFLKIQQQYAKRADISEKAVLESAVENQNFEQVKYEMIIEVFANKKSIIKEFTFNNHGAFISKRLVQPSSYEHILY